MKHQEHRDIGEKHKELALRALRSFRDTHEWRYWDEYQREIKIANKHSGIARAMITKKLNKKSQSTASGSYCGNQQHSKGGQTPRTRTTHQF